MAKIERYLKGDIDDVILDIQNRIINGSVSASLEDSSYFVTKDVRCVVKVFERYSYWGSNRVSLTVTLMQRWLTGYLFQDQYHRGGGLS